DRSQRDPRQRQGGNRSAAVPGTERPAPGERPAWPGTRLDSPGACVTVDSMPPAAPASALPAAAVEPSLAPPTPCPGGTLPPRPRAGGPLPARAAPQLPALLLRTARLADRLLDADDRPGPARLRADPQLVLAVAGRRRQHPADAVPGRLGRQPGRPAAAARADL